MIIHYNLKNYTEVVKDKTGWKNFTSKEDEDEDTTLQASGTEKGEVPEEWDWREYGILNTPRNQVKVYFLLQKSSNK